MKTSIQTLQGGSRLVFDTVEGITNTVERMHETIARLPLPWARQPDELSRAHGNIASAVYSAIRGVNGALRDGVDHSFGLIPEAKSENTLRSEAEIRAVAALNGAFGDHLESSGNALAIPMSLTSPTDYLELDKESLAAALPEASSHLVILVHGLSMSELCWTRKESPCMGSKLQDELGCTPLYLRYNSGRHISTNGREFAQLLEQLCEVWPVPVESLSLVGHSMGGLIIRSACWYADKEKRAWLENLERVVCLGTPHHGSPLAKAGHALNLAMERIPYTEPLAVGRRRSAGIKDLKHGDLLDEDWQGHHPDHSRPDTRQPVPLLPGIDYFFAAASLGQDEHDPLGHALGDILVRMDSAMGSHSDDLRHLNINPENCRVFHEKSHLDLLSDEQVHRQIVEWFSASGAT